MSCCRRWLEGQVRFAAGRLLSSTLCVAPAGLPLLSAAPRPSWMPASQHPACQHPRCQPVSCLGPSPAARLMYAPVRAALTLSTNTSADSVNTSSTLSRLPSRDRPLRLDMLATSRGQQRVGLRDTCCCCSPGCHQTLLCSAVVLLGAVSIVDLRVGGRLKLRDSEQSCATAVAVLGDSGTGETQERSELVENNPLRATETCMYGACIHAESLGWQLLPGTV